jgi:hypothetical protein
MPTPSAAAADSAAVAVMPDIVIEAAPVQVFSVDLVGQRYQVRPPKTAVAMKFAQEAQESEDDVVKMATALRRWVRLAFGKDADNIEARMDDPDDLLDLAHVLELMKALMEAVTENPTS